MSTNKKIPNNKNHSIRKSTNIKTKSNNCKIKYPDFRISSKWNSQTIKNKCKIKKKYLWVNTKYYKKNITISINNTKVYNNKQTKIESDLLKKYKC